MVMFNDSSTIAYTYGADGIQLRTIHKIGIPLQQITAAMWSMRMESGSSC